MTLAVVQYELPVAEAYRLDLTASVLRRLSTNIVDVLAPDGAYWRVLQVAGRPMPVCVTSEKPGALTVTLQGARRSHPRALETVRRMLGTEITLEEFDRAAARIPWLRPLARRMRGVKPPALPDALGGLRKRDRLPTGEHPRGERDPATLCRCARLAVRIA